MAGCRLFEDRDQSQCSGLFSHGCRRQPRVQGHHHRRSREVDGEAEIHPSTRTEFHFGSRHFGSRLEALVAHAQCRLLIFFVLVFDHGGTRGMGPDHPWASTSSNALAKSGSMASGWAAVCQMPNRSLFQGRSHGRQERSTKSPEIVLEEAKKKVGRDRGSSRSFGFSRCNRRTRGVVLEGNLSRRRSELPRNHLSPSKFLTGPGNV